MNEDTKTWSGAQMDYSLSEINRKTTVQVSIDIVDSHYNYFATTFPKGLQLLKEVS